jgi:hypothetical protein
MGSCDFRFYWADQPVSQIVWHMQTGTDLAKWRGYTSRIEDKKEAADSTCHQAIYLQTTPNPCTLTGAEG